MDVEQMEALTVMLAQAPSRAGEAVEALCREAAEKAAREVLDFLVWNCGTYDPRRGVVSFRPMEVTEAVLQDTVRQAVNNATQIAP